MTRIFLTLLLASVALVRPAVVTAATICTEIGGFKCYCSGIGCRKFCKDIIILGGGGGGGNDTGSGELGLAAAPGAAPEAKVIDGLFQGAVSVRAASFRGDTPTVAVFGKTDEITRGRGTLFVSEGDRPADKGAVALDDLLVFGQGATLPMSVIRDMFEPRIQSLSD